MISKREKLIRNAFADGLLGKASNAAQYGFWPDQELYLREYLKGQDERFKQREDSHGTSNLRRI